MPRGFQTQQPFIPSPSPGLFAGEHASPNGRDFYPSHSASTTPTTALRPHRAMPTSAGRRPYTTHTRGQSNGSPSRPQQAHYRQTPTRAQHNAPRQLPSPRSTFPPQNRSPIPAPLPPQHRYPPMMPHGDMPYNGGMYSSNPGFMFSPHPTVSPHFPSP